jgi:hypothetical protein
MPPSALRAATSSVMLPAAPPAAAAAPKGTRRAPVARGRTSTCVTTAQRAHARHGRLRGVPECGHTSAPKAGLGAHPRGREAGTQAAGGGRRVVSSVAAASSSRSSELQRGRALRTAAHAARSVTRQRSAGTRRASGRAGKTHAAFARRGALVVGPRRNRHALVPHTQQRAMRSAAAAQQRRRHCSGAATSVRRSARVAQPQRRAVPSRPRSRSAGRGGNRAREQLALGLPRAGASARLARCVRVRCVLRAARRTLGRRASTRRRERR